jgi:DNA polymerase-3 subunit epsilon
MSKQWAQQMLNSNAVILDTETTGLGPCDQVIQIGVIDVQGNVLFDTLLYTDCPIAPQASVIHGITKERLIGAPTWPAIELDLLQVLDNRPVLIYNAGFDFRMLIQTAQAYHRPCNWITHLDAHCVMKRYANGGKWAKLEGGDHTALGDCRATLALLKRMAGHG